MNKKFLFLSLFVGVVLFLISFNSVKGIEFSNPIGSSDFSTLAEQVLSALRSMIAVLAIIFIVVGGIMYMISGGNQGMMEKAKKTITAALIGLVIALSANTFLVEIWDILEPTEGTPPAGPKFKDIAVNVLQFLLSIVGILAIIGMVVGGMMMMTAYGNQEKITKGKNILTYSIIGIVISLSALIIVRQVSELVLGTG
jgi:uncharacterized membrane protein (UPF0182 family)